MTGGGGLVMAAAGTQECSMTHDTAECTKLSHRNNSKLKPAVLRYASGK